MPKRHTRSRLAAITLVTGLALTGLTGVAAATEPHPGAGVGAHLLDHATGSGVTAAAVSGQPQLGVGIWGS
ncbi:hypothetical protein [Kitasatospora purpeofusca]|uniref:hypothetical protein n=1 Tax=Kitasatospora purpeofusca TaxID=67352 RepID=UPI002E11006C|nr:hypothetical protein OG715_03735 [Kitasatospora purpeofusca]WSR38372.1 hypothetical protein OG196_04335 [Kitasatospora purpeofusca]